jgi:2-isopropylmalate synthase
MRIAIYDTTLRDGTQRENIALSVADKLRITQLLDDFGVSYIEGLAGVEPERRRLFRRGACA